jgi:curli production assembly/transport component CsgG
MRNLIVILFVLLATGCATHQGMKGEYEPAMVVRENLEKEYDTIPAPALGKVSVAVYGFADKTGQRRPAPPGTTSFSTAVTQGADALLIKSLQDVGRGEWFDVVERVGLDNLLKERQIIKQMREAYEGSDAKPLMPMKFAGIIFEGGIVGYDSATREGGAAYRMLGIGPQTQYSEDIITVNLRAISVNTGKVLASVNVKKTVYSTADSLAILKFYDQGTQVFEFESGITLNEPATLAVKAAIDSAVVELIKEGQRKNVWDFKQP